MDNLYFHFLTYIYPLKSVSLTANWGYCWKLLEIQKNQNNEDDFMGSFYGILNIRAKWFRYKLMSCSCKHRKNCVRVWRLNIRQSPKSSTTFGSILAHQKWWYRRKNDSKRPMLKFLLSEILTGSRKYNSKNNLVKNFIKFPSFIR